MSATAPTDTPRPSREKTVRMRLADLRVMTLPSPNVDDEPKTTRLPSAALAAGALGPESLTQEER